VRHVLARTATVGKSDHRVGRVQLDPAGLDPGCRLPIVGLSVVSNYTMSSARGHVFISHAHTDAAYAARLAALLSSANVPVWTDEELLTGERWISVIRSRLDSCVGLVVVMSPAADESVWVEREIRRAEILGKPILPCCSLAILSSVWRTCSMKTYRAGSRRRPDSLPKLSALVDANARGGSGTVAVG
jgi:hypothetical protein